MPETTPIHHETLPNGMTVLVQSMPWQRTAAFSLSIRGGVQAESDRMGGLSGLVCEIVQRGAGSQSSRDLVAIQDNLGMDRNSGVSTAMVSFTSAMPAASLQPAIELYADIVRRPHLPADQLDDARMMSIQELRAMEDEPTHRVMRRLRELHYGDHLGRSIFGTLAGLEAITQDDVRQYYTDHYHAGGAILAVAGNVNIDEVMKWSKEAFADWKTGTTQPLPSPTGRATYEHMTSPSSQTHIGFAFDNIPYGHVDYFKMRAGIGILSDGMSSRLFDRVREQRGLCYTVSCSCHSLKHCGGVFGYAGTTPERAQETLDVTLREIEHLVDDLESGELERWKVRIQSGLIMEQESSASRAASLASDWYQIEKVMTTEEIEDVIESLTLDDVRGYWCDHPPGDYRIVTLGPDPLSV
ncbi:Peptidase M16 inactive domain protein [Rubripirellula lacrimiformis]|uniref:Peptidase M16 inactive domain protein n=1 Tax=Rubripirellula lacrimiformis TaxID=1930273 RepID=A0A517NJK2_9BACT|nr:pitrilysin family protein [Rubripirellula lacrimiformis]QDT07213.1 Peptidase M16 inactive domain protein [Rubripirellula lacrimiformis]